MKRITRQWLLALLSLLLVVIITSSLPVYAQNPNEVDTDIPGLYLPLVQTGSADEVNATAVVESTEDGNSVTIYAESFSRVEGKPGHRTQTFTIPDVVHGPFILIVENGDASGANRVSAANIKLNGTHIFKQADFNQNVGSLEREVALLQSNTLDINILGKPRSFLTVSALGVVDPDTVLVEEQDEFGALGGVITLPNVAQVYIPPDTVESAVLLSSRSPPTLFYLAIFGHFAYYQHT